MVSIGLVLGAGGVLGGSFHAGVLAALDAEAGFDARDAALVIGTSAGANTASSIRGGLSAGDHLAIQVGQPLSVEGRRLVEAATTLQLPNGDTPSATGRRWASPRLALAALPGRGRPARPVMGLVAMLRRGIADGSTIARRADDLNPAGWPAQPTWIVSVALSTGRRVVFGRDDVGPAVSLGTAVQASSSVPSLFEPVAIGRDEFVDGGIHSSTNADLASGLQFDLIVVSAPMTAVPPERNWRQQMSRAWHGRTLDAELARLEASGTPTIVVSPTADDIEAMGPDNMDNARQASTALQAYETTRRLLDRSPAELVDLLAEPPD